MIEPARLCHSFSVPNQSGTKSPSICHFKPVCPAYRRNRGKSPARACATLNATNLTKDKL
jgi:hypothetical protein